MASKLVEKAPGWVARILLPEFAEIKGELKNLSVRIDATNNRIDEMEKRLSTRIDSTNNSITELDNRLTDKIEAMGKNLGDNDRRLAEKIDDLDKRLDMAQRLAVVEAKIKDQEARRQ